MAKKKVEKKAKAKAEKKPKIVRMKCSDCGATYDEGALHTMFCVAHTCSECGTSFSRVLPVTGTDDEGEDERLCPECLAGDDEEPDEE